MFSFKSFILSLPDNFVYWINSISGNFDDFHIFFLTPKAPNTTIAEFANTVDPDEMAHIEPSHLDLQCLPSSI